jgi:hypothetical protein
MPSARPARLRPAAPASSPPGTVTEAILIDADLLWGVHADKGKLESN